jgi:hypothetical protein
MYPRCTQPVSITHALPRTFGCEKAEEDLPPFLREFPARKGHFAQKIASGPGSDRKCNMKIPMLLRQVHVAVGK